MTISRIVTHPGRAHRDDFLAVAIALATYGCVPVFRREPTSEELEDENVLVLDTGERHEPGRLNFDHHQLDRGAEADCALHMFVRFLGHEEAFSLKVWYAHTALLDSKGPIVAAKSLGLDSLPVELMSPIEGVLLGAFGEASELRGFDLVALKALGNAVLANALEYAKVYENVRASTKVVSVAGIKGFLVEHGDATALHLYRKREVPEAAFSITKSDREGESWALYRYDDDLRIDFSRIGRDSLVAFAHKGGFLAKLSAGVGVEKVLDFVKAALV